MRKFTFIIALIIVCVGFESCYKEEVIFNAEANRELELPTILKINGKECAYDYAENSLRYPLENLIVNDFEPLIEFQKYSTIYFEGKWLKNKSLNNLGKVEINKEYEVIIETDNTINKLKLKFTNLPIVQIVTPNKIYDEPKTVAKLIVNYKELNRLAEAHFIGLEYRGGSSQAHSKKSFGLSLKSSLDLNDDLSSSLFNMKKNNDWILDAMWIDKGRLRNKTSFELWKKMDTNKHKGISGEFVELYINNEHQGVFCLNENVNSELLNLNNNNAVLYKATSWENGETRFESYSNNPPVNYYWDGWEQKHPDPKIEINWQPLNELRNLVVNGSDAAFTSDIASLIDINNFVDYYIFLNLVSASDNTGKNTFLVKESDQSKMAIIPWDIDGSWGVFWNGDRIGFTSVLSNNLFDRLLETNSANFKTKLKQRWSFLRGNTFSNTALKNMFIDNFTRINYSKVIEIENRKWNSNIDINVEQAYLINWIENRLVFLDNYFNNL